MGKCKYCGQDSGFFHSSHEACERKYNQGLVQISQICAGCFSSKEDFYLKDRDIKRIISDSYIDNASLEKEYLTLFDNAVNQYLNDGVIDNLEEKTLARFIQFSGLPQATLNTNKSLEKMLQSKVIQDILAGNKPAPRIQIFGDFPFMLGKTESLVWLFRNITLHQLKVKKEYVGRTHGMSFRIMKGIYYRTGGFKGYPVETTIIQKMGTGSVCLTDKNIYFASPEKSIKIPYNKILSVDSYSNGIGIQKDGANDKPIFLEGVDSWFAYNVIVNYKQV